jgi:hypothetical protein
MQLSTEIPTMGINTASAMGLPPAYLAYRAASSLGAFSSK